MGGGTASLKGAPHSALFAWYAFQSQHSLDEKSLTGWTSPASKLFEGYHPKSAEELAAKYQELSNEASRQFLAIEASHPKDAAKIDDEAEDLAPKTAPQQILPDAGLDALRDMLVRKGRTISSSR